MDARIDMKGALKLYKYFHLIKRQPTWGKVTLGCLCKVCFPNCVCRCTLLCASLFNPEIRVPADYIAATISERKSVEDTAGRKCMSNLEEQQCNQKKIDSMVGYLEGTTPTKSNPAPETDHASSFDVFEVIFSTSNLHSYTA
jgi:hypothetical protein